MYLVIWDIIVEFVVKNRYGYNFEEKRNIECFIINFIMIWIFLKNTNRDKNYILVYVVFLFSKNNLL